MAIKTFSRKRHVTRPTVDPQLAPVIYPPGHHLFAGEDLWAGG
jgi:hypothetical protein